MSTYIYLECLSHDPPLTSDSDVGQHLYDLPRIRRDIANRELFIANAAAGLDTDYGDRFVNATAWFLRSHPRCDIGIYADGEYYPTTVDNPDT
jgi:hypothetical protein